MAVIDIKFIGSDYSPFRDVEIEVFKDNKEIKLSDYNIDRDAIDAILLSFMDKVSFMDKANKNKDGHVINTSDTSGSRNQKGKKELYSQLNSGYFFSGVAGILRGKLKYSRKSKDDSWNEIEGENINSETAISNKNYLELNITLQIQSRFDKNEKKTKGKPYFLSTMVLNGKLDLDKTTVPSNEEEIYDYLLLFWFKEQLENAYFKGLYRTYRRFERNDDKLKGTIDIARHIRLNVGQNNGKIAYSYRENTPDNPLNQMIVMAYEHLKRKYPVLVSKNFDDNPDMTAIINQLKLITDYQGIDRNVISKNLKPISSPYYTEYEELRKTSIQILRDEGISFFDGDSDDINGILFYLPDLWEDFLEDNIESSVRDSEVYMKSQEEIKALRDNLNTRPDFVFHLSDTNEPFMILDAKFKPGWGTIAWPSESNDAFKLNDDYTKCLRDMVDISGTATGVIFPTNITDITNGTPEYAHEISGFNKYNRFYTFPVRVPYSGELSYNDWLNEFENYLKSVNSKIYEYIKIEKGIFEDTREARKALNDARNLRK